jgi:hypothetical protein
MEIKELSLKELKKVSDEGLILQGCGGNLSEWVDGVNEMLTDEGILLGGDRFTDVSSFRHDGHTNLLFNMKDVDLDIGKLAVWRLRSHAQFGGTWLSDYLPNRLGVRMESCEEGKSIKPYCELIGQDGNIFNLMGIARKTLVNSGMSESADEMCKRIRESGSYSAALNIIGEYVNITGSTDDDIDEEQEYEMPEMFGQT